jgi:copper chaperone CopZ
VQAFVPDEHLSSTNGKGLVGARETVDNRPQGWAARLQAAFVYGTVTLPGDIGRALLVGILIAGFIAAAVPADFLDGFLGAGALSIALMMIVGIPIYVCATASVPLAAGFIAMGATPGAALAFLIAGPATNAATLTTVSRVLGRRTMVIYLLTVAVSAFGGGLLLDWLLPRAAAAVPALSGLGHDHGHLGWIDHVSGAVLVLVMTWSWWRSRRHDCGCDDSDCADDSSAQDQHQILQQREFDVVGMNCSHCSNSVDRAIRELAGVTSCQVRLDEGRAVVAGTNVDSAAVVTAVVGLGFRAQERRPIP